MKKLYLSLLLATTIISVSCMEKEKPRRRTTNYEVQFPSVNPSTILPVHVLSTTPTIPICEANQPGWQQLDHIANMTYKNNQSQIQQSSITDEFELRPIYKPANTIVTQKEQKPLLHTNSLQPDEAVMQDLYKRAASIVAAEYDGSRYAPWAINDALVTLITAMISAKNNGISEEIIGEFAYEQKKEWHSYRHEHRSSCYPDSINIAPLVPITFILLKKYNTTIHQTNEQIPLHFDTSTHTNQNNAFLNTTNVGDEIIQYPAFFQLHYTLRRAIKEIAFAKIKTFITYVYENNDISQEGYSDGSYKNLNSEFYATAYNYLFSENSLDNLYSLLQIIDKAKELREINNENDLIACINPENKPVKGQIFGWFASTHSDDNVKHRITLLCKEIEKYNKARDYQLTPTIPQYQTYYVKRFINVPLPGNTHNSAHLDDTFYAFEEFEQLRKATQKLIKLTIEQVNEQIKDLNK